MTLDLDDADLRVIDQALSAQPYGLVAPLIAKINAQLTAQRPAEPADR